MRPRPRHLHLLALATSLLACAQDEPQAIRFEREVAFLPDFERDTGYLPADSSEAQVRVLARAGGSMGIAAEAMASDGILDAVDGSGIVSVGAELRFEVFAKLDVASIQFDDVVASMVYEIPAVEETFTPFLLGEELPASMPLPAQTLGSVPIPSVPGASIRIDITGGQIDLGFKGQCAASGAKLAQYMMAAEATGVVELAATVVVEVPVIGGKEFGPFALEVPVPATEIALDLGTYRRDGTLTDELGPCEGGDGVEEGGAGGGGEGGEEGNPGGYDPSAPNCGVPEVLDFAGIKQAEISSRYHKSDDYYSLRVRSGDFTIDVVSARQDFAPGSYTYRARAALGPSLSFSSSLEGRLELVQANGIGVGTSVAGSLLNATFRQSRANGEQIPNGCSFKLKDLSFLGQIGDYEEL